MQRLLSVLAPLALALVAALPLQAQERGAPALPAGEGRDILTVACTQCHGLSTIMALRDGEPGWRHHVGDMVMRGAQVTEAEFPVLVFYLTKNFGPGSPRPAPAVAVTLPNGAGKELVEQRCTLCHDLDRIAGVKRDQRDWESIVANMVARGAPASADEARGILAYLTQQFGRQ
jgi:cytochrome c5